MSETAIKELDTHNFKSEDCKFQKSISNLGVSNNLCFRCQKIGERICRKYRITPKKA